MGRPRLPDEVKRMRGTLRHSRTNPDAPRPPAALVPPPPRELTVYEQRVWRRLARELAPGVFTTSDYTAFRLLVSAVAAAEHPAPETPPTAHLGACKLAASLLQRFGMDPGSREKVSVARSERDDRARALAEFNQDGPLRAVK